METPPFPTHKKKITLNFFFFFLSKGIRYYYKRNRTVTTITTTTQHYKVSGTNKDKNNGTVAAIATTQRKKNTTSRTKDILQCNNSSRWHRTPLPCLSLNPPPRMFTIHNLFFKHLCIPLGPNPKEINMKKNIPLWPQWKDAKYPKSCDKQSSTYSWIEELYKKTFHRSGLTNLHHTLWTQGQSRRAWREVSIIESQNGQKGSLLQYMLNKKILGS